MGEKMNWPDHLPQDCPPTDAENASGKVYRLIEHEDPGENDFLSWVELNPGTDYGEDTCKAGGLSVLREYKDAEKVIKRIPAKRDHIVSEGHLNSEQGKIFRTPTNLCKSHCTWWYPRNIEPWIYFRVK